MRRRRRGRRRMRKGEEGEEGGSTVQNRQWSGRKYWVTHNSIFMLARIAHSCENIEFDVPKSDCSEPLCGRTQGGSRRCRRGSGGGISRVHSRQDGKNEIAKRRVLRNEESDRVCVGRLKRLSHTRVALGVCDLDSIA